MSVTIKTKIYMEDVTISFRKSLFIIYYIAFPILVLVAFFFKKEPNTLLFFIVSFILIYSLSMTVLSFIKTTCPFCNKSLLLFFMSSKNKSNFESCPFCENEFDSLEPSVES